MSKQTAHKFISNYYDVEKSGQMCERKSFIRFRDAMPSDMDDTAIEEAYAAFSGKSPRYNKATTSMEPWRAKGYKRLAHRIVDALTHEPTSLTDLATSDNGPTRIPADSIRKCFKEMAAEGFVGCMEIKTCGKCHIRLYYLND